VISIFAGSDRSIGRDAGAVLNLSD
jgi:hypothetical protein